MNRKKLESNTSALNQAKLKASEFIQNYERQATERQFQKQKLKQNIMLEIMSNRHKSQKSESNGRDNSHSEYSYQDSASYKKIQSRVVEPESEQRKINYHPLNRQTFGRSSTMPEVFLNKEQKKQKFEDPYKQNIQQENRNLNNEITFKGGKEKGSYIFVEGESAKSFHQEKEEESDEESQSSDEKIPNQMTFREEKPKQNSYYEDKITSRASKYKLSQSNSHEQSNSYDHSNLSSEKPEKEVQVFENVIQNQSMELGDENEKNFVNFVAGEEQDVNEDIEKFRKKKIQELKIKSQRRKQEAMKKNEEGKRSDSSLKRKKTPQNYGRKSEQKISEDPEPQPPRLKGRQKQIERQDRLAPKQNSVTHESHYGINKGSRKSTNHIEKEKIQNNSYRPVGISYNETPKTIQSESRNGKSRNKNTIFRQSPSRNEKSANKYLQQPKIEPKQRKNTFIKQSNKKLMMNAISNVCLPGQINRKERQKLLQVIDNEASEFFVFLFKEYSRKVIKAIYKLDHTQTTLQKIYGQKAPSEIISEQVSSFYRFDSGCRQFKKLDGCKSFSLVVHAIDLR